MNSVAGRDLDNEGYRVNRHAVDVARIGYNSLSKNPGGCEPGTFMLSNLSIGGDLMCIMATAMSNCNRPFAAFGYLDTAENYYMKAYECFHEANPGFGKDMQIAYEVCRAKEAAEYTRLIEDIPLEHRPMFATVANSYITHAVVNLDEYGGKSQADFFMPVMDGALLYTAKYPMLS